MTPDLVKSLAHLCSRKVGVTILGIGVLYYLGAPPLHITVLCATSLLIQGLIDLGEVIKTGKDQPEPCEKLNGPPAPSS